MRIIYVLFFFIASLTFLFAQKESSNVQEVIKKGKQLRIEGKYDNALKTFLSIYPQVSALPDSSHQASNFYKELVRLFSIFGAKQMALKYAKQEYVHEKKIADVSGLYLSLGQIASFYMNMAQYDSAELYFRKALNLVKGKQTPLYLVGGYNNMGMLKWRIHSPDAKAYYDTALVLIHENRFEHKGIFASVNDNLAELFIANKDYEQALMHCNIIENWLMGNEKEQNTRRPITAGLKKAECLWKMGNQDAALGELSKLSSVFTKPEYSDLEQAFYQLHIDIFNKDKQYHQVAIYQDKLILAIQKSLKQREEITYKATEDISQIRFDFFQQELAFAQLAKEGYQKTLFFIVFMSIILIVGVLFYYKRKLEWQKKQLAISNKQKETALQNEQLQREYTEVLLKAAELEKENISISLEYRKKELSNTVSYLANLQNWNQGLVERLNEIQSLKEEEKARLIQTLILDIKNHLSVDDRMNVVHDNIGVLNQEFYVKMREKYPDISLTELEICAYFRMNLANKDIAALRNTSLKAVQMARYRIRKKLNIAEDADIHVFLQAF